ncbi:MAG: class II aldolase/adducin family protein [Flavobacteriales bacterium]|nr:class II aldolase/adducin family protein [Flavobacteriales bacterium]
MSEIKNFVEISRYAGERYDLVQAAGGNSSIKLNNGEMLIKASGFLLSDVNKNVGYSRVFTKQVADIVINGDIIRTNNKRQRESLTAQLLKKATIDKVNRPSIETLLHSLLLKYTLHTHSIVVNMIVVRENWKETLNKIFKDIEIALVAYKTPGIELALELDKELQRFEDIPKIIFLQNHGLIVTSNEKQDITKLTEYVLEKIESFLNVDMSRYKLTNSITNLFNSIERNSNITYLSEDAFLNEQLKKNKKLFLTFPFCPDTLVYCGVNAIEIDNFTDLTNINNYKTINNELPKVILHHKKVFFIASNIKKAKEIEEVLKFHIMVLIHNKNQNVNFLDREELAYLSNWEAEKFRQEL